VEVKVVKEVSVEEVAKVVVVEVVLLGVSGG